METVDKRVRPRFAPGVASRIFLLATVPVIGLGIALGVLLHESAARVRASRAVSAEVDAIRNLAELHRGVSTERLTVVATQRLRQWNLDEQWVTETYGVNLSDARRESVRLADEHLAMVTEDDALPVEELRETLAALRVQGQSVDVPPQTMSAGYDALLRQIAAAIDRRTVTGGGNDATVGGRDLRASMARLHAAVDAYRFGAHQVSVLTDVWFTQGADRDAARISLAQQTAQFERAMSLLMAADEPVIDEWMASLQSKNDGAYDAEIALALSSAEGRQGRSIGELGEAFTWSALRQDALADVVLLTADDVAAEADVLRNNAVESTIYVAIAAAITVLVTLAIAVWASYSITRPLRRLVARATRIRDGDLAPAQRGPTGPHDLRLAALTVEQLVENLRLLDAKSMALSRNDLEAPVLDEALPGRLGTSLQASTRVLRESMAARDELQQRLWHEAHHDSLTGIANRFAAIERLTDALDDPASGAVAVLFIDLDNFKLANDTHGHAAGDDILRKIAARMSAVVRTSDFVGRLGGDEFMVLVPGVERPEQVMALARRLLAEIRRPIEIGGSSVVVGGCAGVAFAQAGEGASEVLARADLAVYQAKQGDDDLHVYDEHLHREIQARRTIEKDLTRALRSDGELELHYQPIVDAGSGEVRSVEALLRWNRPGEGLVPPSTFIAVAESSALILEVDRWVLARATAQAARWAAEMGSRIGVSVNVSGRHLLQDSFVDTVAEAITAAAIDPDLVTLELTESVLLDDLDRAAAHLRAVRQLGVHVVVDDFGTGYTSIAHLHALPIDGIKVDRSFVIALPRARDLTIVRTLVELGHQLGLSVVAEGVETEEQRAIVQALGCEGIQGYLVGRPRPAADVEQLIQAQPGGSSPIVPRALA